MYIAKFGKRLKIEWWNNQVLTNKYLAIDTETSLITSPAIIPNLVITTVYDNSDKIYLIKNEQVKHFIDLHKESKFIMWNAAFDVPVLESVGADFDFIINRSNLIDGQILYRSLNIALYGQEAKKWSLDFVTEALFKVILEKNDDIRLTFGQYIHNGIVTYNDISNEHLIYAALDPVATYLCAEKILAEIKKLPTTTNLAHQINLMGDLALSKVTRNGISINLPYVDVVRNNLEIQKVKNSEILASYGYFAGKKGNKTVFENICKQEKFKLPLTETGKLNSSKRFLEEYNHHPFVAAYLDFNGFRKQQNFLNDLISERVYPRYNTIKVTSRTSCSGPNIQNMPRIGGIRECFIPSSGNVFIDCDYSGIELVAISAINLRLFKHSVMADLINQSKDLHTYAASKIYNVSESEVSKEQRQTAKILNFGLVANMSPQTFVSHAAKFGLTLTLEESIILKDEWGKVFPEMVKYWKRGYGRTTMVSDTGFIRENCSYTEFLNCPMQLKSAEGAKIAVYNLNKAGYKVVAFVHDQVLVEHPLEGSEQALEDVKRIMIESMQNVIIGVKVGVSGEICDRFKK